MPESKGLNLTLSNLPEKYKDRILERRRTHGTRRTTFRDFKIILPPRPAEQPRSPEQILQHPDNIFDYNFNTSKSVSSKRKSVYDDDESDEQLVATPTPKIQNNDLTARSRSSQMSLGSPMEIDYSIDVGNIEVLISKARFGEEEKSDIVMMDETDNLTKSPEEELDNILDEIDILEKSSEEQLDVVMDEVNGVDEGGIQVKSSEEQSDIVMDEVKVFKLPEEQEQVTEEIETSQSRRRSSRRKSKTGRDVVDEIPNKPKEQFDTIMDEKDVPAESQVDKSSVGQEEEQDIEGKEINQSKKKSSRRKKKVGRSVVKDKSRSPAKSPEQIDEDIPNKSLEEQVEQVEQITEEREIEISQSKKKPTRRKNKVGRGVVKNNGKAPVKSPEQSDIVMDEDVPDKPSEEPVEQMSEEREKETSKSRKRPTRRKNKVGRGAVKNKGKAPIKSSEKLDVMDVEDIPEDIPAISPEDQDVSEGLINQPFEDTEDPEEAYEEQITEEREIRQGRRKSSRRKIKCHKIGRGIIQDKDGNTVKKTSATKLNELDVIGDSINDIIAEFLNDNSFKKEIQHLKNEIESNLLEQSDLLDEQIMLRSSLRQSKSRMNCLRKELLDVQRERDNVCKELANERRTFASEEQDRKKLEQAHNFLTDLETLREVVDAEDDMQEDEEGILDGFKGLLVSVTSRKGRLGVLSRFNMLLEVCEKMVRQTTDT